jgi:hypothetical protein
MATKKPTPKPKAESSDDAYERAMEAVDREIASNKAERQGSTERSARVRP